jgi:hypothetical protein
MLALPAKSGRLGKHFFRHRRGIDEDLDPGFFKSALPRLVHQPPRQRLERPLDRIVIVRALGIDRDPRPIGHAVQRQRIG